MDGFEPSVTSSVREDFEKKQRLLETLDTALELVSQSLKESTSDLKTTKKQSDQWQ